MKLAALALATAFATGWLGRSLQDAPPPEHEGFRLEELSERGAASGKAYLPFLERATLSVGLYRLPAGATDGQSPHELDEVYYVARGRSAFTAGDEEYEVEPGTILFVERKVPHRFHDIEEDLEVVVFFSKAKEEPR